MELSNGENSPGGSRADRLSTNIGNGESQPLVNEPERLRQGHRTPNGNHNSDNAQAPEIQADTLPPPIPLALLRRQTLAQPYRQMSERSRKLWNRILEEILWRLKVARMFTSLREGIGQPCTKCASMKLTESKFLINDFANHQRSNRMTAIYRRDTNDHNALGPGGLDFGPNDFELGTLPEIYSRGPECPFCLLAAESLQEKCEAYARTTVLEGEHELNEIQKRNRFYENRKSKCWVSWQIDGRKLIRDEGGKIISDRACTRRLRLRWVNWEIGNEYCKPFDTYVVLMAPKNADRGLFLGRSIESVKTDAARIRQWVSLCEKSHGDICKSHSTYDPLTQSFFGVIDVNEMCLTRLPRGERYIALSYSWGKMEQPPFHTNKANIRELLSPGGIREHQNRIPRTIRHAIELVVDLGEKYLWVDSLCIIQDSARSWALNSKVMDSVYGNAYLTICAADGDNANSGLRGLHNTRAQREQSTGGSLGSYRQNIVQFPGGFRLMTSQPAENYIADSKWNTRGWTFQERLLSARNLIFAAGRVYFQCRCTARSVDIITEHESVGWSIEFKDSPLLMLKKLPSQPLSVYKQSLQLYMDRELTKEKDILAAFTGIGNLVCEALGGSLVFGLPSSHFDWALLWEPLDAAHTRPNDEIEKFPSWSWCGWKDQIMEYKSELLAGCEENLHDWLMKHTWITWYIRDGNGNLRLVWDGQDPPTSMATDSSSEGYRRDPGQTNETHDKYGRFIPECERHRPRSSGFKEILDECPYDVNITQTVDKYSVHSTENDMPFLQFWTWSAFFGIRELRSAPENLRGKALRRYSILDYKEDWCGTILLDKKWVDAQATRDNQSTRWSLDKPFQFIAISDAKRFDKSEYTDWANYIPVERKESTWDLYYVLLIKYKLNVAYRVGLGKVYKSAFENSWKPEGKQWKEFILG